MPLITLEFINRQPTSAWKKQEIVDWLNQNGILYPKESLNSELLGIARVYKQPKKYVIDEMAAKGGHLVLSLPPLPLPL
jgi:hypothetical protein